MNRKLLSIYVGWDSRESVAYHVLCHSIIRRASGPVAIIPVVQSTLRKMGLYTRERNAFESTEFSFSRFLVPYLSGYCGHSIFMDCDMLVLCDLHELRELIGGSARTSPPESVLVVKHDYTPRSLSKFLGQQQTAYPRKNWSSLIVFNNERCRMLTPQYVNKATGLELHRFLWIKDEEIGSLAPAWNYLIDENGQDPNIAPKILHFTNGGPYFPEYANCSYAEEWREEYRAMTGGT